MSVVHAMLHGLWFYISYSLPAIVTWELAKWVNRKLRPRWALAVGIGLWTLWAVVSPPLAHADPVCNAPGLPVCAGPAPFTLTPAQQCAVIAWRTWIPCNWFGAQVPQGTPGSVG